MSTSSSTPVSTRRRFVGGILTGGVAFALPQATQAVVPTDWPQRPIRLIVPQGAGGGVDIVARLLAPMMTQEMGQPIVIDNRPGAAGNIGTELVVRSQPDGYTILFGFNQLVTMNPHVYTKLHFNGATDLLPVTQTSTVGYLLTVNNSLPVKNIAEFVAYAKDHPGKLSYGTYGQGSSQHVMTEMLMKVTGIEMVHVPYKSPPTQDLLAGNIQVLFDVTPPLLPFVSTNAIRALGFSGPRRHEAFPTIPTLVESYPGLDMVGWQGVWAPRGTPQPIIDRLNSAFVKVVQTAEMRKKFAENTLEVTGTSTELTKQIIAQESERWKTIIRERNITSE